MSLARRAPEPNVYQEQMSLTVITYNETMSQWEPNARGQREQAALELYHERGFDQTTVADGGISYSSSEVPSSSAALPGTGTAAARAAPYSAQLLPLPWTALDMR